MRRHERVELRDVFSIETKLRKSRIARNPKTNEKIYVKDQYIFMDDTIKSIREKITYCLPVNDIFGKNLKLNVKLLLFKPENINSNLLFTALPDLAKSIALKPGANVSTAVIPIFSIIAFEQDTKNNTKITRSIFILFNLSINSL